MLTGKGDKVKMVTKQVGLLLQSHGHDRGVCGGRLVVILVQDMEINMQILHKDQGSNGKYLPLLKTVSGIDVKLFRFSSTSLDLYSNCAHLVIYFIFFYQEIAQSNM